MPKFVKGDVLLFKFDVSSFHNLVYEEAGIDKCIVIYSDDVNYYFESSRLAEIAGNREEGDEVLLSIPINEIDNTNIHNYTIGLKTLLKKI